MTDEPTIREMPHAEGSEKFVLSSFMKDPALIEETAITEDWFYDPGLRTIFREMIAAKVFDLPMFAQSLHDRGLLDSIGGASALSECYTYAVGPHFELHLARLRDRLVRRMTITAARDARESAYDCSGDDDAGNVLQALSGPITAIFDIAAGATPAKDTKALAKEFLEEFEAKVAGKTQPMGIPFGIPEIDRYLRGLHPQQIGIISARSGGGKSTLATQIASSLAAEGIGVLYLILERTEQSAFQRSVIQLARLHHAAVADPAGFAQMQGHAKPDRETLTSIRTAIQTLVGANLHIRKPSNRRLTTQCAEIRRYHRMHGIRVVFLDQIGLVRGERQKGDSAEVELRGISNTLQELAHELGITIIVLSQVTEDGDTKGARAIEEDADWWLSIIQERDKKKSNFGEHQHILIAKDSHNGKAGERLPLILDEETLRFVHGFPEKPEKEKPRGNRFEK